MTKHLINAAKPRLSDEEPDLLEQDDVEASQSQEDWLPWDIDDLIDIKRIIEERMSESQREVIDAFLSGINFTELGVTEKYYRYHYQKAIEFIRKELGL